MFSLYYGNDAATLANALGENLARRVAPPLVPERILVPQAGLRRWLEVHLASARGAVANLAFAAPAQFAWDLLSNARAGDIDRAAWEPAIVRWHLFALLGEDLSGAALEPVRRYLEARGNGDDARLELAGELARAFERYQAYRRERVLAWQRGAAREDWQAELWRRLVARAGVEHRASLIDAWLRDYGAGDATPPGLPPRLSVFACSNVSPDVLRLLGAVARHIPVDFYLPTPCREYYGDVAHLARLVRRRETVSGEDNPLLVSFGAAGAAFVEQVYSYEWVEPEVEVDLCDDPDALAQTTLLDRVKADVLARRRHVPDGANEGDASIQLHACHSRLREVEVLHDRLLAAIATADPKHPLHPRDIAVMTPDIAAYRPYIEAVFGGLALDDPRYLPYAIGDLPLAQSHPAVELFLHLLDVPLSRWQASELLDVLAVPGVMRRLGIDAAETQRLGDWLRDVGVRWGEDERARAEVGGYREFSWAFGLDRLLVGYAHGESENLVAGVAPFAHVEGSGADLLDSLLTLLDVWRAFASLAREALAPRAWQERLNAWFDRLYAPTPGDADEARALTLVRDAIAALADDSASARVDAPIAWNAVRMYVREKLAEADLDQRFFTGGITFCGMVPLRVVPFRVVALIGMDEDAYPRRDAHAGIDRLPEETRDPEQRQRGDRSLREDDRYLFLQLITAARDVFYVSYVGRDARSNKSLPPSLVVAELRDTLERDYGVPSSALVIEHPLQPFDLRRHGDDAMRATYRSDWLAGVGIGGAEVPPPFLPDAPLVLRDDAAHSAISLGDIRRLLRNPARAFLEQRLGVALDREADDLDAEPLDPNGGLLQYQLRDALARAAARGELAGEGWDVARANLRARALLPAGALGDVAFERARSEIEPLLAAVAEWTRGTAPEANRAFTIALDDGTMLAASLDALYPHGRLLVRAGGVDGRHFLDARLALLALAAAEAGDELALIHLDDRGPRLRRYAAPSRAEALGELADLVELYREGLEAPLALLPRVSAEYFERASGRRPRTRQTPYDWLRAQWQSTRADDRRGHDLDDISVALLWRGRDLPGPQDARFHQMFEHTAERVFRPLYDRERGES